MSELIGVIHPGGFLYMPPKREALLFDRVAVVDLKGCIESLRMGPYPKPYVANEYEWLVEQNIVFEPKFEYYKALDFSKESRELVSDAYSSWCYQKSLLKQLPKAIHHKDGSVDLIPGRQISEQETENILDLSREIGSLITRFTCIGLSLDRNIRAFSLWEIPKKVHIKDIPVTNSDIVSLVFNKFPVPDELTPWENIIEFRRNQENRSRLTLLRNWTNKITRQAGNINEAEEELEALLYQYQQSLDVYEIKYSHGILETLITTTAEWLEMIAKLQIGKMAKTLFNLRRRNVDLLEAETKAPGREISYILGAQRTFNPNDS